MKIKYDSNLMKFMSIFTGMTNTRLKDCFIDNNDMLVFVVSENMLSRAIGKHGYKAKQLEKIINRKIKILEFNPDLVRFVRNVIYPLKTKNIEADGKTVRIEAADIKTRGLLIGRSASNLHNFESCVKRYFDIDEIRVL